MMMCEIFGSCFTYIQSWIGTARVKEENSSLAFLQISCWGKHFIGLDYLLCVNTQPWKPWQWRGELISSGGTEPGSVCGGVRQLLCTFLSLSVTMLCQGHFQPYFYPPLLFTTPSFSSHSLSAYTSSCFFPSDTQFFSPLSLNILSRLAVSVL